MPIRTTYIAQAPLETVEKLVTHVLADDGWQVRAEPATTGTTTGTVLVAERGKRLKTLLLASAAGDDFHLCHRLTLTPEQATASERSLLPGPGPSPSSTLTATRIEYPTSGASAITRGGVFGADLEMRTHAEISAKIAQALQDAGVTATRP